MTNEEMLASWQYRRKQMRSFACAVKFDTFNGEELLFADDETVSACRDACLNVIDKKITALQNSIKESK